MMEHGNSDVRAYVIWGPFLKGDTEAAARQATDRYWGPNSVYFWTPTFRLAWEMASALQLPAGRYAWDVYLLYKSSILWDREFPLPSYWQQQLDVLQGDKYDPQLMRARLRDELSRSMRTPPPE